MLLCALYGSASEQGDERFTLVSIKPSADNGPGMAVQPRADAGYSGRKVPIIALLTSAYELSPERIVAAPRWTERYDIEARFEPTDPKAPLPLRTTLLKSLLKERFGLVAHTEKREFPVYLLRIARNDGGLGPGLKPSTADCADDAAVFRARQQNTKAPNGAPACGAIENPEAFIASGTTMDVLANALRIPSGRPVINSTGLGGKWDVTLEFAPLQDVNSTKPSVFTAIQEQLQLRLESSKAPLDVLVIDAITRPTAN
jgi:uncharacterized protein (TIGR03435 family)